MPPRPHRQVPGLRRGQGQAESKPRIFIYCEGEVTEPRYIECVRDDCQSAVVSIEDCGLSPLTLVQAAVEKKKKIRCRSETDPLAGGDQVWCVFDVDTHPERQQKQAYDMANANGVNVALSNPCFEVWPILHIEPAYDRPDNADTVQKYLSTIMPKYHHKKNPIIDYAMIRDDYPKARTAAERQLKRRDEQRDPKGNPSTNVFDLIDLIIKNGRIRPDAR